MLCCSDADADNYKYYAYYYYGYYHYTNYYYPHYHYPQINYYCLCTRYELSLQQSKQQQQQQQQQTITRHFCYAPTWLWFLSCLGYLFNGIRFHFQFALREFPRPHIYIVCQ